jgi:hypothetical protein
MPPPDPPDRIDLGVISEGKLHVVLEVASGHQRRSLRGTLRNVLIPRCCLNLHAHNVESGSVQFPGPSPGEH